MDVDLVSIDRYLKIARMASAQGTTPAEAAAFQRKLVMMEAEYVGIRELAADVRAVIEAGGIRALPKPKTAFTQGPGWSALREAASRAGLEALERVADDIAGQVTGADRHTHLDPKECVVVAHSCAPDQVCVEIRMRRRDALRDHVREAILDQVEDEIVRLADQ